MADFSAPAKINLHLRVLGKRPDGYHELATSFAFVDVADMLRVEPNDKLTVHCSSKHLNGENNLVWRVLQALRASHGVNTGLAVHIDKHLPEQAGLGGGSSDAATALMAANRIWGLGMSTNELIDFAVPFGADIPCFLFGRASMARGIGAHLQTLETPLPDAHVLLAYPGVGLSTAGVFKRFSAARLTLPEPTDTMRARIDGRLPGYNDLEEAASHLCPDMARMLGLLRQLADRAWMSGSGTACVGLFEDRNRLKDAAERVQKAWPRAWVHMGTLLDEHPFGREWKNHGA
ncbi:MAG: 4-(cytidine 5'-diphospho)-2-C-methyl-D-erythritol kinase [Mariprofundaceae bacterium]